MTTETRYGAVESALRDYLPELPEGQIRERLRATLLKTVDPVTETEPELSLPSYDPARDGAGLLRDLFEHCVRQWTTEIQEAIGRFECVADPDVIADEFTEHQTDVVSDLLMRTLLDQLHELRAAGALRGATPEERYRNFREWTNSKTGQQRLTEGEPGLLARARRRVQSAERYLLSVLDEFASHREKLAREIPGVRAESRINRITTGAGDTHNGGKSTALITLTGGTRLLYKPHDISSELGYNSFVAWINEQLGTRLPVITATPSRAGGFVEFVPTEIHAGGSVEYFTQIGQLAGILYLLKATDIHYENVVTCSLGPVVVDTETLLTPRLTTLTASTEDYAVGKAVRAVAESVAGIGILPMVVKSKDSDRGIDIGAIGYDPGQQVPFRTLAVRNAGRDDMCVELRGLQSVTDNANMSVEGSPDLPVREQRDLIKREFRRVAEFAAACPAMVSAMVERCFAGAVFRYVHNPTVFYAQLLRMVTHPGAHRDPLVRAALLNRVVLRGEASGPLEDEEVRQLDEGDVPYFTYRTCSRALLAGDPLAGSERIVEEEGLAAAPLDLVTARIAALDEQVIRRELDLIDLAFVNKLPQDEEPTGFSPRAEAAADTAPGRDRMLAEAVRVGEGLLATMVSSPVPGAPATWIAPQVMTAEHSQWSPGTLGYDLYGGSPGLALLLAGLGHATGEERFRQGALDVLGPMEEQLRSGAMEGQRISVGGMTGLAGTVYAINWARRLIGPFGTMTGGELAQDLARRVGADCGTDLISGMAGTLAVCLSLYRGTPEGPDRDRVRAAVRQVAETELAALRQEMTVDGQVTPYTGYAHGVMGIAPVLLEYAATFGDEEAAELGALSIRAVLRSESASDQDWPRTWGEERRSYGWCHGAPGMLLGGLAVHRWAPGLVPESRLSRMAELTLARGFGNNPTYCHGDIAGAEILAHAEREMPRILDGRNLTGLYPRLFSEVVERYELRTDTKYGYSSSMLVGRSGSAWSVLRHLHPGTYPSVLRFE